jgi:hypothetical protein
MQNFTARDVRDMDLAAEGGITHMWFTGPVLCTYRPDRRWW